MVATFKVTATVFSFVLEWVKVVLGVVAVFVFALVLFFLSIKAVGFFVEVLTPAAVDPMFLNSAAIIAVSTGTKKMLVNQQGRGAIKG